MGAQFQDLAKGVSGFASDLAGGNTTASQVAAIEITERLQLMSGLKHRLCLNYIHVYYLRV